MPKLSTKLLLAIVWIAPACNVTPPASTQAGGGAGATSISPLSRAALPTTDGTIAIGNLNAQIDGEERLAAGRPLTVTQQAAIADALQTRGQFLGRIDDYERAQAIADRLVRELPTDGHSYVARAQALATFHQFDAALADLDMAEHLGVNTNHTESPRAAIFQAVGRLNEALALRQKITQRKRDIRSLSAEASVYADLGQIDTAEKLFTEAQHHFRDVSPFPVAWLYFQQGKMWMREGNVQRARDLFAAAHERLPQYAPAQGHLAEMEALLGHRAEAMNLLRPLTKSSDDPDYAMQLARIAKEIGDMPQFESWKPLAQSRYEELLRQHPDAFADHGTEFWLDVGGDPAKALVWAQHNRALRPTTHAFELLLRAAVAAGDQVAACAARRELNAKPYLWASLRILNDQVAACT